MEDWELSNCDSIDITGEPSLKQFLSIYRDNFFLFATPVYMVSSWQLLVVHDNIDVFLYRGKSLLT